MARPRSSRESYNVDDDISPKFTAGVFPISERPVAMKSEFLSYKTPLQKFENGVSMTEYKDIGAILVHFEWF